MNRIKFVSLLLMLAQPALASDSYRLEERVQIPVRLASNGQTRYVSTMTPRGMLPLFQIVPIGGGGGVSPDSVFTSSVTVGSALGAANSFTIAAGVPTTLCWEGATADAFQTCVTAADTTVGDQTWTIPNSAGAVSRTFASLEAAQVFSGGPSFSAGLAVLSGSFISIGTLNDDSYGGFIGRTTLTPDATIYTTGSLSNSVHLAESADRNFDFNNGRCLTAACTNPSLIIHSPDQVTTEYTQISTDATGMGKVQSNLAEVSIGGFKTAITEGSAQAIIRVGLPTATSTYGMLVTYNITDINGVDYVTRGGRVQVQGGNSAGTAVCTINTTQDAESEDGSQIATSNAATLTYTWTNVVSTSNCDLSLNAASSEGVNTLRITWTALLTGNFNTITITPQ